LSKDSSIEAAAHVYIVYDETQSEHANPNAKDWMERQIEDRNTEIDEHNEKVASDRKRAKAFKAGTLSKDDLVNTQPANEANRKEIEEERARLTELAELTDEDWAARRKVRVGARKNTDDFTTIVKLVLNFERRADASVTSRFATVLEWIHATSTVWKSRMSPKSSLQSKTRGASRRCSTSSATRASRAIAKMQKNARLMRKKSPRRPRQQCKRQRP
jgi:hypothetical protein